MSELSKYFKDQSSFEIDNQSTITSAINIAQSSLDSSNSSIYIRDYEQAYEHLLSAEAAIYEAKKRLKIEMEES